MNGGNEHKPGRSTGRSWRGALLTGLLLALALVFLQIERGTGNPRLVLLFAVFDMLLVGALTAAALSLTLRWRASLFAGSATVLSIYFISWLKMQYTAMAAQASDLMMLYSAWDLVKPFTWPAAAILAALAAAIALLMKIEKPLYHSPKARLELALLAALLFVGCATIDDYLPQDDLRLIAAGPGAKIAVFYRSIYRPPTLEPAAFPAMGRHCCMVAAEPPAAQFKGMVKPNLVVVLQESTFPPSNLHGHAAASNFLFDGAAPLKVHVRGSGTWVEEFAVLHGVPPPVYGEQYAQVNWLGPAMQLPGRIAPLLAGQGYETASIYPTAGEMLWAESMHRSLGMQRFIGCKEIAHCSKAADWNMTPDSVFFDEVLKALRGRDKPQFIFAGTMRQHSPHFEQFPLTRHRQEVMQEYERRLAASSQEAEAFVSALRELPRPTIVLMFGDHIPSDVVAAFDERDFAVDPFQTFFNLYDTTGTPRAAEVMARFPGIDAVDSAFLDVLLLDHAGFGGDYISTKLEFMRACGGRFCGQTATTGTAASIAR